MRREPWLRQMCERIEKGDSELKHRLPVWTPHCAEFRGNHRAMADAVKPLPRLMLDFDEKGRTDEICARLQERSPLEVLLIEESVRRGTHVLVALPDGMQAEEAQRLMAEATGCEPDRAVKDVSRCIYMVTEEHTRFVSKRLFSLEREASPGGEVDGTDGQAAPIPPTSPTEAFAPTEAPPCFKGIPYASIITEYWRCTGGEPSEGERNVKLHRLAVNLRAICDNKPEVLMAVMPRLGLAEQELKSIVLSACKEPTKGSRTIDRIVKTLEQGGSADEMDDAEGAVGKESMKRINV
ncbi:MAG: hypothetical protein K2G91_04060, partial [Prevotella sp.]|nr:hypothetical protein [Prevotella sp.]